MHVRGRNTTEPWGTGHKCSHWPHKSILWILSVNVALLVDDAIYAQGASTWEDRTNCHWGSFPNTLAIKRAVLISDVLYSCSQTMAWEHFSSVWLTLARQEHSSDWGLTLQKGCWALADGGNGYARACKELVWLPHHAVLKPGLCFHNHKTITNCIRAQKKNCKTHSPSAFSTEQVQRD